MKKGDKIIMYFHFMGLVSKEKQVISHIDEEYIHLDNDCDEDWIFLKATGECINDNTYGGAKRTIKPII